MLLGQAMLLWPLTSSRWRHILAQGGGKDPAMVDKALTGRCGIRGGAACKGW